MTWESVLKIDWREIVDEFMQSDNVLFDELYNELASRLNFNAPTKDEVIDYLEDRYERHNLWNNLYSKRKVD
jgi:hypothetical protein